MSNAWVIYLVVRDNRPKGLLIPDEFMLMHIGKKKGLARYEMSQRPISLLVG